jgi:serine/threonine protein kinase
MLLSGRTLKLCDFGLSGQIGQRRPGKPHGTTPYMAPELLVASATVQHTLTAALDIWSFGIVLYAVIFASLPWDQATERDVDFVEFVSHRDTSHCEPWSLLHPNVRGCVLAMLDVIPRNRPSAVSIGIALRGPWMEDIAIPHDDDVQLDVQQLPWPSPSPWPSRPGSPEDWQDDDLGGGAMFLEDTPMHSRDARPHSQ